MSSRIGICSKCNAINRSDSERAGPICGTCKSPLAISTSYQNVTSSQLAELVAKSPLPVVVDFWAEWCPPCKAFAPTFERTAKQFAAEFVFVKLNTEEQTEAAALHGIRGLPTIAVFQNGKELKRQSGAMPEARFLQWLRS